MMTLKVTVEKSLKLILADGPDQETTAHPTLIRMVRPIMQMRLLAITKTKMQQEMVITIAVTDPTAILEALVRNAMASQEDEARSART